MQSLVIAGKAGVGFKDSAVLNADAACSKFLKLLRCLNEEVARKIFSRRIELGKGLEVIDHLVVQAIHDRTQQILEQLEVEEKTGLVQMLSGERDKHAVVMAVRVLAF